MNGPGRAQPEERRGNLPGSGRVPRLVSTHPSGGRHGHSGPDRRDWLPDPDSADGTFIALQEVGRYLRGAELTLIPDQQHAQLTQLFGQLIVERLNGEGRRVAEVGDCAAVLPQVLDRAGSGYLDWIVRSTLPAARAVLDGFAVAVASG